MKIRIAKAKPFEGAPKINIASIIGASAGKPILFRVPVTGQRPIEYSAFDLPKGLTLKDNIVSGFVECDGNYEFVLCAKNALGECQKKITLEIKDQNVLVTPLLGYTTWNAFASGVKQSDVEGIAKRMVELGITEYGYGYVNTDSGWQGEYGGEFDAVMPNKKFPDMKGMTDKIHALGLKCGIYSTPMLNAWGCPDEYESIPGCTQGEADYRFADTNGGIGVIHKEENNARQWEAWGFDYLKYDWAPTDPVNAELMRQELIKLNRDFGFCVTVRAIKEYWGYWSRFCNSYRSNSDTYCNWENLKEVYNSYFDFMEHICKGHYFDLDMLDFGTCRLDTLSNTLTDDEKVIEYSMRAFLNSPIQISSTLENAEGLELDIYCNEEIIAINQDCAFNTALPILRVKEGNRQLDVFEKQLENGDYAYAIFNLGEVDEEIRFITGDCTVHDVWAKECLISSGEKCESIYFMPAPHTVRIIRTSKRITVCKGE